ncbi:MAG: two-component system response regulator, partial [Rhodospirillaceae bacterium]|nr:two-component system response regulator [Rhodospirillales bacterium]
PEQVLRQAMEVTEVISPLGAPQHSLREMINQYEARAITESLARNGGSRMRAAQELGISRRSLLYKLQEYGIG